MFGEVVGIIIFSWCPYEVELFLFYFIGSLNFCNLAPIIAKTFKIMGLTKYCETFDDEDAALEKLV